MNIAIVLAGGSGRRFGNAIPKQYLDLNGIPVVDHVIKAAKESALTDKIILVINDEYKEYTKLYDSTIMDSVPNGKERHYSVLNALNHINKNYENCENIIILDGVGPFVTPTLIDDYFTKLNEYEFVTTAKKITGELANFDMDAFKRDEFAILNSPEAYKFDLLYNNFNPESEYTEIAYQLPKPIKNYYNFDFPQNLKITYDFELEYARQYLKSLENKEEI